MMLTVPTHDRPVAGQRPGLSVRRSSPHWPSVSGVGRTLLLLAIIALQLLVTTPSARADQPAIQTIRVAAFHFPPAIFQDPDGTVKGWYIDLLSEIGNREKLHFVYVYGTWAEGLERARRGEVDLLTSVARTEQRETFLAYGKVPILTVWGELFVPENSKIDGILQLEGKTVAIVRNDFNGQAFQTMAKKFGITCKYVELESFEEVFKAIDAQQVDAGVVSRLVAAASQRNYRVKQTGVIFNPFDIFFAAPSGARPELLATLDLFLTKWHKNKESIYYRSRARWFSRGSVEFSELPRWLLYVLIGLGGFGVAASVWVATLRRKIRQATAQILATEGHFRLAVEEAPFPTMMHAEDGEVLTVNRAWREISGYTRDDLPTIAAWAEKAYGAGHDLVEASTKQLYTLTEREQEGEYIITCKDGSSRTWDFSSMALGKLPDGRRMAISMANDVTQRQLSQQALAASEERLRLALAAASQGLYDLDLRTGAAIVNADYALMLGYDPAEFRETNSAWRERLHPDDRDEVYKFFQDYLAGHHSDYRIEFRQCTRQGDWIWILSVAKIVERDAQGTPLRMLGTHTNITAAKQVSEELQAKNAEMERFIYTISHDLKSPIVTIKGFLELLTIDLEAGQAGDVERDLNFIHGAADRITCLLEEVLELSRIGRVVGTTEELAVTDLVNEAINMVGGAMTAQRVKITVAPCQLILNGDRSRLIEVWQNLVENAVKYMGEQPAPHIDIGVEKHAREIVFFVRDNGIGIDSRYQEKIFGLFEKLDPASAGTGLGLALVKRIVEMYKGRVWVESAGAGHGSCFFFTLPSAFTSKEVEQ